MSETTQKKDDPGNGLIISYMTLRKVVGWLGILLPVALGVSLSFFKNCSSIQNSISDYYYTRIGGLFTGVLCAVALFLFSYNGYEKKDGIASRIAALFALGVAFFPTSPDQTAVLCSIFNVKGDSTVNMIHFTSATIFFLTLAYMSFFLFTKSSGHPTKAKRARNKVYKTCGVVIAASIVMILLYFKIPWLNEKLVNYKPVFVFETIALWAFGLSWLTKGEFLLKDD
jgi:hypothetical protein